MKRKRLQTLKNKACSSFFGGEQGIFSVHSRAPSRRFAPWPRRRKQSTGLFSSADKSAPSLFESQTKKEKQCQSITSLFGGELGIRTLGSFWEHDISSVAPSTSRTFLQICTVVTTSLLPIDFTKYALVCQHKIQLSIKFFVGSSMMGNTFTQKIWCQKLLPSEPEKHFLTDSSRR